MARQTIVEKIMSRRAGQQVRAGEVCICDIDGALATDGSAPMAIDYFHAMGGDRLKHPDRIIIAMDHYDPAPGSRTAELQDQVRRFTAHAGGLIYDVGAGIGHQLMIEQGHVSAGGLYVGADSHTVTYGALNAFAAGVGSSDIAAVMRTGELWFTVPQTIRIDISGELGRGVSGKDIALWMTGVFGGDGAAYRVIEFSGPGLANLCMDDRIVLSNMVAECGAKAGIFPYDEKTEAYLKRAGAAEGEPALPDPDADYERIIELDLSSLEPMLAIPDAPHKVTQLASFEQVEINAVYLGTCTGGRVKDFHEALEVIGKAGHLAKGVDLFVTPASDDIYKVLVADGSIAAFTRFGARIMLPGCGACCGTCGVIPGDRTNVISTANRNFKGRMGNPNAAIYLASPAACAASAVTGRICDPREYL